jgi:DNA replication licensing factor MCM5
MREEDRVAIHEAMEQQTISVAKAGITTILNSRCSVLAAANPVYGRYDDKLSIADNINLLPTILSRFDLMFIVRDERNDDRDRMIARHVVGVHVTAVDMADDEGSGARATALPTNPREIDLAMMKKFIQYARLRCAPVITAEAAESLASEYAEMRQSAEGTARRREGVSAGKEGANVGSVVPITVRQLEALVRVTESVAKASLATVATSEHVKVALSLFKKSTLAAAQKGLGTGEVLTEDSRRRVQACEARVLKSVGLGQTVPVSHVKSQLRAAGFDEGTINTALRALDGREEVRLVDERKSVRRIK